MFMDHEAGCLTEEIVEDPMSIPKRISETWKPQLVDHLPDAFCESYVIHWVRLDRHSSVENAYIEGIDHLEKLVQEYMMLSLSFFRSYPGTVDLQTHHFGPALKNSNMASEEFKKAARGGILVASSPKFLPGDRPLAGTARRGKTPAEDEMRKKQLLSNEKECAEHIMLVDLGRNDVGKVLPSAMSPIWFCEVEKLMNMNDIHCDAHKLHGELQDHLTSWDALRAALPVGTVSGAPKVKAMELIDALEVSRRGPYSGGFGAFLSLAIWILHWPSGLWYSLRFPVSTRCIRIKVPTDAKNGSLSSSRCRFSCG
ncbi:hypothetical protein F3Y22_tig00002237pilonHSYRG00028 [Hibiscus syriacus]|uniref:Chorismate-utilising enzyme C-terminal domain-containing protein n=1 Tax=Hibiscus syriacus TaxID=106335 RepID=A0A6A3CS50_HIBSY|nr:hypothetical protein F3Y22_tig00002237pilonHSYRG00028 [Hibiscus syriacus]